MLYFSTNYFNIEIVGKFENKSVIKYVLQICLELQISTKSVETKKVKVVRLFKKKVAKF